MSDQKTAVCVVVLDGDKVLAVSRRGQDDQWGLPGGKVELGEELVAALVREVREETGLVLQRERLFSAFSSVDEDGYLVFTYVYEGDLECVPRQGDAGAVEWVSWKQLISGPFKRYNADLHHSLKHRGRVQESATERTRGLQ